MRVLDQIRRNEKNGHPGFTLIEVMVAITIGMIVMGMAVAILGVTNSVSLRVLSKSEAQQTTRGALSSVFDSVANADALDRCRVGTTKQAQLKIQTNPQFHPGITPDECKETASSGHVLALAQPNRLCYFDKDTGDAAADIRCIARGGNGATSAYVDASTPIISNYNDAITGINFTTCFNPPVGTDPNLVYKYTCKPNSGSSIDWPSTYGAPQDQSVIADLSSKVTVPENDLFDYLIDGNGAGLHEEAISFSGNDIVLDQTLNNGKQESKPIVNNAALSNRPIGIFKSIDFLNITSVVGVNVNMTKSYDNQRSTGQSKYKFRTTVVLRGSDKAQEDTYNG